MQAILDIFRGKAPLADAPEQQFETTTTSALPLTTTTAPTTGTSPVPPGVTSVAPSSTATSGTTAPGTGDTAPQSNIPKTAIVPDPTVEC
jgi:hypothetical protein